VSRDCRELLMPDRRPRGRSRFDRIQPPYPTAPGLTLDESSSCGLCDNACWRGKMHVTVTTVNDEWA